MTNFWRKWVVHLGYILAGLIILAALFVNIVHIFVPALNEHRAEFEKFASRVLDRPVQIANIDISWHFFEPELVFDDVTLFDQQTRKPILQIPLIKINFELVRSLFSWEPVMDTMKIAGVHLTLFQQASGAIRVPGFQDFSMVDNLTGQSLDTNVIFVWIFSQPKLVLQNIAIQFVTNKGEKKEVMLSWLALRNSTTTHELSGKATLNQSIPTQMKMDVKWEGNVTDLTHVSANLYFDLKNVSLAQWESYLVWHDVHVMQGLGSAKIWAQWNNNAWQKIQSDLTIDDITAESISTKKPVAMENISGKLDWDDKAGNFTLDSKSAMIQIDQLFRYPLEFEQLSGALHWQQDATGAWVFTFSNFQASNQDMNASMNAKLTLPLNDSANIDLKSHFVLLNAARVSHYLPLKIFHPKLMTWLSDAFLTGRVAQGTALLQGRLQDFPFDQGQGKFEISARAENVDFHFAPDWPDMHNINGKLLFSGRSMTIDADSGYIMNVPIHSAHANIPYFGDDKPPVLDVQGSVQSDLKDGMQFIMQSPLQQTIGKDLENLNLQGPMQLALKLTIPLHAPQETVVDGQVHLTNGLLQLPVWKLEISRLNGAFNFTEKSITASHIQGQLFSHPVQLDLGTEHVGKENLVTAKLQGNVRVEDLKSWLALPLPVVGSGTTDYHAELHLPAHESAQPLQVTIHSDLQGIALDLPGEYGKTANSQADFQMDIFVREGQPFKTKLMYNKLFSLALVFKRSKQNFDLISADVHLGTGDANWQTQPGIIITGNLQQVDWSKIQPSLEPMLTKKSTAQNTSTLLNPDLFRAVDLKIDTLNIDGLSLKKIRIQLTRKGNDFSLGLNSADMAGDITLPRWGLDRTVQARFQYLHFTPHDNAKRESINPKLLPPISFVGNDVRYADMNLGHVILNLVPTGNGVSIKQLTLDSSAYTLQANGYWVGSATSAKSHLQGTMKTSNVSAVLTAWGLSSANLVGTKGDANFNLTWSGTPFNPGLRDLDGTLSLNLGEGRIINLSNETNAKMGLGRILNVLSLQSLPRRLSLDFSDVFEKGYSFDFLKGDFTFKNGAAMTQNMHLDGPIAGIEISGRMGLITKDFNLKLSVTPYVTASLPVVAAIATVNPVAGIATWMLDKVVGRAVSQIITYNYTIIGPWDNPVWTQLGTQKSMKSAPSRTQ